MSKKPIVGYYWPFVSTFFAIEECNLFVPTKFVDSLAFDPTGRPRLD